MTDWALYLDECGSNDPHDLPLKQGQTPVFSLGGVILPCDRWREYDREYLYLKRQFFAKEINESSCIDTAWEAKGNFLLGPRNATSSRNKAFVDRVLDIIVRYNGRIIGVSFIKDHETPMSRASMYTKGFQILAERYDHVLRSVGSTGFIIADSRMAHLKKGGGLDYTVAVSYLSYIFGHLEGKQLKRIVEAPLFADSKLTTGLQIADIVAMLVYTNTYRTKVSLGQTGNVNNYVDYTHTTHYWPKLSGIIFKSDEMFGIRTIDHRKKVADAERAVENVGVLEDVSNNAQ